MSYKNNLGKNLGYFFKDEPTLDVTPLKLVDEVGCSIKSIKTHLIAKQNHLRYIFWGKEK